MGIRIRTDGDRGHREDVVKMAGDALEEDTTTGAVIAACRHARQDVRAKERALEHPDMTEELAEILSTEEVELELRRETSVET
jgi:hypothetical protein